MWTRIECGYCVNSVFVICLDVFFIFVMWNSSLVFKHFIDIIYEVVLAPTTKTMIGATFHPLVAVGILRFSS